VIGESKNREEKTSCERESKKKLEGEKEEKVRKRVMKLL